MRNRDRLQAPVTIFVDEAGSADFREPQPGKPKRAVAMVAVAVDALSFQRVLAILPRGASGRPMKSTDVEFTPQVAECFVQSLLASSADVGAYLVDPGRPENIALAERQLHRANEGRRRVGEGEIRPHELQYMAFLSRGVCACLEAVGIRRHLLSFVDIVIDNHGMRETQRAWFEQNFARDSAKFGLVVSLQWRSRLDEPLLLLPDLVGGILCREDKYRDVGPVCAGTLGR